MSIFILILIFQSILPNRVSAQERDNDIQTVLGRERANPYTIENITKAYKELNPESKIDALPITDRYVKFSPKTYADLALLDETDVPLFDFPISHEIEKLGDYYIAPGKKEEDIPEYYALVDPWFKFPEVPYVVIADMHISIYDSKLTQLAFEMVGEEYEGEPREDISGINFSMFCQEGDPNWPQCNCDIFLLLNDQAGYENCLEQVNTPPTTPEAMSECGCRIYNDNQRKPGGSVRVEDTQFNDLQGVNNIRIVVLGAFWQIGTTKTDAKGCWKINKKFNFKPIAVYAIFRSSRITVRAMRGLRLWQYARAVQTNRFQSGPDYRNICMEFNYINSSADSKEKMVWHAAHANNTVYDYDTYSQQDNIGAPPNDLIVFLSNVVDEDASAPMLNQMQKNPGVHLATGALTFVLGTVIQTSVSTASIISTWVPVLPTIPPPPKEVVDAFVVYFIAFAPDVFYSYGGDADASDVVNEVFFHEYGHAAHYKGLSNKGYYWSKEILYIVENLGYGDGTAPGAERAGIIEAWAGFIGIVYVDRKYGDQHSAGGVTALQRQQNRYIYGTFGERHIPVFPIAGNNQFWWIPFGMFMDCIDDTVHNGPAVDMAGNPLPGFNIVDPITENIQGYSIQDCYNAMITNSPTTVNDVEQNLINNLPAGQNAVDIQTLIQAYGF